MNKNFADDALRGLLGRSVPAWARCALVLLATAVFAVFAYHARYAKIDEFTGFRAEELIRFTTVVLAALYALTAAVTLHIGRRLNFGAQALFCVVIGAILLAKVSLFDYVSDDYDIFLSGWIYSYSQMGIREGLGSYIGFQRRVLGAVRRDLYVAVPAGAVSRAAKAQRMEHDAFRRGALL